jgi:hypothetical protein
MLAGCFPYTALTHYFFAPKARVFIDASALRRGRRVGPLTCGAHKAAQQPNWQVQHRIISM